MSQVTPLIPLENKMKHKFYNDSIEFYTDVKAIIPELNFNKTLSFLDQSFMLGDKFYDCIYLDEALKHFNKILGKEYYSIKHSEFYNEMYTIFFEDELSYAKKEAEQKQSVVVVAKQETLTEEEGEENSPLISLVAVEDDASQEEPSEPNWKWIESLKNVKKDKTLFDKYAEEEFKIKLNRTNTLANMIVAFKEAL